jgi:hypothetical protein
MHTQGQQPSDRGADHTSAYPHGWVCFFNAVTVAVAVAVAVLRVVVHALALALLLLLLLRLLKRSKCRGLLLAPLRLLLGLLLLLFFLSITQPSIMHCAAQVGHSCITAINFHS